MKVLNIHANINIKIHM